MKKNIISIIIPIYNEASVVQLFFSKLLKVIKKLNLYKFEIIVINDGSNDKSLNYLLNFKKKYKELIIVDLSRNFGKESALTAGIDLAKGNAVIPIDVDLQDPPELIIKMIKKWENGSEIVVAKRTNRDSDSFLKRTSASLFYFFINILSQTNIPRNVGDFRLMDKQVIEIIKKLSEKNRFMKGIFSWPGFKVDFVEYERHKRVKGKSNFNFIKLLGLAIEAITSFSVVPLKIISIIGFFGIAISFIFSLIIIYQKIFIEEFIVGYAFITILILFFGSIQLLCIGIVGEYIGKIYYEVKNRPLYVIKKIYK